MSAACTGVRALTAELGLSGRAGEQRLRGRVVAGFARPDAMRLEGVAPFGAPAFVLAARGGMATLLLPRDDNRVLRDARPEEILGAITGVALAPADLQAILTGCVTPLPRPTAGRLHQSGWASIELGDGATLFLASERGAWVPRAARRGGWRIDYPEWRGGFPAIVRLRSESETVAVDLTAGISQLETNREVDPAAFEVTAPRDAREMTLRELQIAGPLRGQ